MMRLRMKVAKSDCPNNPSIAVKITVGGSSPVHSQFFAHYAGRDNII